MADRHPSILVSSPSTRSEDSEADAPHWPAVPWAAFRPQELGVLRRAAKRYQRALSRRRHDLVLSPDATVERLESPDGRVLLRCKAGRTTLDVQSPHQKSPYGWVRLRLTTRGDVRRVVIANVECVGEHVPPSQQVSLLSLSAFHSGETSAVVYLPPEAERVQLSLTASDAFDMEVVRCEVQEVTRFERTSLVAPPIRRTLSNPAFLRLAWRRAKPYIKRRDFRGLYHKAQQSIDSHFPMALYLPWIERFGQIDVAETRRIGETLASLADAPLISIVMPTYNTDPKWLEAAIESVEQQAYPKWELCIADDGSTRTSTRDVLREAAARDPRIKVIFRQVNGHISAATNTAIEAATGSFVGFLDHDDALLPHALLLMVDAIRRHPEARLFYSDEDKLGIDLKPEDPYFKPDFGPDLLRSQNFICHFTCLHKETLEQVGGLRKGFEGAQDWDLMLRTTERLAREQIVHVRHVLYHWRRCEGSVAGDDEDSCAKPYAYVNAEKALAEHLERCKLNASIRPAHSQGFYRTRFEVPDAKPHVTLIVPTRDNPKYLRACIDSIRLHTNYRHYDILVVDNDSHTRAGKEALTYCGMQSNVRVLRYPHPFNFSAINNFAVRQAKGDVVCLVNDDIESTHADWLEEMLGHVCRPDVGAVGPRLLYPDGRLQHAGVALGIGGVAGHVFRGFSGNFQGYFGRMILSQNFSALTGACLMVKKSDYWRVGGFDEKLTVAFNDVDFTLKLHEAGLYNVYTPYATLLHKEGSSRGHDNMLNRKGFAEESRRMVSRWRPLLADDPFYNPNLSRTHEDMSLAFPPRQTPMEAIRAVTLEAHSLGTPSMAKRRGAGKKQASAAPERLASPQ